MPAEAEEEEEEKREKEEKGEEEEEDEEYDASHLPLAPSSEDFDVSTTVDSSFIISLMRKLLPSHSSAEDEAGSRDQENREQSNEKESSLLEDEVTRRKKERNGRDEGQVVLKDMEDRWEEYGCVLWDLSTNKTHAEFMVNNLLLDVLLATLQVSKSSRVTEIALGIIGNLSCHINLCKPITSTNGLLEILLNQLFEDDSVCLSEMFRILSASLQGSAAECWTNALLPDHILQRILWIIGNTLNFTLLEKGVQFLVAIVDNEQVANVLLQPLINLGLPNLLSNLLMYEICQIRDENKLERSDVLELILRMIEGFSTNDGFAQSLPSNLLPGVCDVIKILDKEEIANSCACAVTIIANAVVDDQHLISALSKDLQLLHGLFDILPFVSDDPQVRDALWVIISKLVEVPNDDLSPPNLHNLALLFVGKSSIIEEDISGHHLGFLEGNSSSSTDIAKKAITTSLAKIACILEKWFDKNEDCGGHDEQSLRKLLDICQRHLQLK